MIVVCQGRRESDGAQLVLVRCRCGHVAWFELRRASRGPYAGALWLRCPCGRQAGPVREQPTLAEADAPRSAAA